MEYTLQRTYKTLEKKKELIQAGPAGRKRDLAPI